MRTIVGIVIFFMLVLPALTCTLVLFSVNTWLTDGDFYAEIFDNEDLYADGAVMSVVAAETLNSIAVDDGPFTEPGVDTVRALTQAFEATADAEVLRDEVMAASDALVAYLNGDTDSLSFAVDVTSIKNALVELAAQEEFAAVYTTNLVACPPTVDPLAANGILYSCIPTGANSETVAEVEQEVLAATPAFLDAMPDTLTTDVDVSFSDVAVGLRTSLTFLGLFAVFLLFATALIASESRKAVFLWMGGMTIIAAMFVLMIGFSMGSATASDSIRENTNISFEDFVVTESFEAAVIDTLIDAASRIAEGFILVGGVAALIAVILMGLGLVLPGRLPRDDDDGYVQIPA